MYLARGPIGTKYLSTSTDGINWVTPYVAVESDQDDKFKYTQSVAYGNGVFVAVGSSGSYISTDAINWNEASTSADLRRGTNLIFDGEKFVVIDAQLQQLWTSTNGTNWQATEE
jgi:hypothetical protein